MRTVPADFFATSAQVVVGCVLVFVVESQLLREGRRGSWLHTAVATLLVHCLFGVGSSLAALAGSAATEANLFLTTGGLLAAGLLVLLPAFSRLVDGITDRENTSRSRRPFSGNLAIPVAVSVAIWAAGAFLLTTPGA